MTQITVWYDGLCPLCVREIALMRKLDKHDAIHFVDAQASESACPLDRELMLSKLHAAEGGSIYAGAEAFALMWRAIPLLRPLGLVAQNRFVLFALERAYRVFLKIRPFLQRVTPPV